MKTKRTVENERPLFHSTIPILNRCNNSVPEQNQFLSLRSRRLILEFHQKEES